MGLQEIFIGVLFILAIIYIVRFIVKSTKSHQCDDCSLMEIKKESDSIKTPK